MSTSANKEQRHRSPARIIRATLIAAAAAAILFLAVILPAEFGSDPLGTGNLLGLTELSRSGESPVLEHYTDHATDTVEFVLEPFQSVEYKYVMDEDNAMVYSWQADAPLYYDMHADPGMSMEGYDETFGQGESDHGRGAYVAPFTGIHGWFWENRSSETITIRLQSAGFYVSSSVFRDGGRFDRDIENVFETGGSPQ
ncbi:MAG: hypothetical protein WEB57_07710 [Pseudohongiellaceae bacterium]